MFTIPQCHIGGMKEVYVFDNNKTTNNRSLAFSHIPSKKIAFIRHGLLYDVWVCEV